MVLWDIPEKWLNAFLGISFKYLEGVVVGSAGRLYMDDGESGVFHPSGYDFCQISGFTGKPRSDEGHTKAHIKV